MIKKFEEFICEQKNLSYEELAKELYPGESVIVQFPPNFELDVEVGSPKKFICGSLDIYCNDDDDRRGALHYLLHKSPDGRGHSVCKTWQLTPESREKVYNFIKTHGPEGFVGDNLEQ
jgi:hypothetical protein